mmetsp:Transcript_17259/g.20750  ORF Transcript_17259/g.20750 Transcript_17259/m.20750 type:complete len:403 (-) Transcript_17259:252-1460(-)|eukprot:CAMPEP_0197848102 /NCGR_PEP_ID=MMETSP1438-20131217/7926_1 /TAXON_ID=1461541 /ORGANISM="Pterosperma sp., Strain CCMP1384" /LENGTH=402 /DNA_ID=CAMNT_0043460233 /DNA_START=108 /DNA_END=1316 /DNA_ORIENTATION=+
MKLTVTTDDDKVVQLDIEGSEPVENVQAILEIETGIPIAQQRLVFNAKQLNPKASLTSQGVADGDLFMLIRAPAASQPPPAVGTGRNPLGLLQDGSAEDPVAFQRALASNPAAIQALVGSNAALANTLLTADTENLQLLLKRIHEINQVQRKRDAEERALQMKLAQNPMDMEAQRKLMEIIEQKNINDNYEQAMEFTPESFGRVTMLYVNMEVNGVPLKAFVDSGAQSTIMSEKCAEKCNILRLVDKRFAGVAKGVGTSKIVGRIHQAPLRVGNSNITCSITVLENQDMEFLFGLDMLKRFQVCIDLKENQLRFGSIECSVPFLGEGDLPAHLRGESEAEPSSPAAGGGSSSGGGGGGSSSTGADEGKIKQLMEMGFTKEQAVEGLRVADGNVEGAANYLFQ